MGGLMGVSVRFQDGTQKHLTTWTNSWPDLFLDVENIDWQDIETNYTHKKWKTPHKSEYGIIFIDYKNKSVYSRQGYCRPFQILLDLDSPYWTVEDLVAFQKLGEYARANALIFDKYSHVTDTTAFAAACQSIPAVPTIQDGVVFTSQVRSFISSVYIKVHFLPSGWSLDHEPNLTKSIKSTVTMLGW